jgi:ankyrin repeat protein
MAQHPQQRWNGNGARGSGLVVNGPVNASRIRNFGNNNDSHDTFNVTYQNGQDDSRFKPSCSFETPANKSFAIAVYLRNLPKAKLGEMLVNAAMQGEWDQINLYIKHGADPNHAHNKFGTPLLQAVIHGHHSCADILLSRGASKHHLNCKGLRALDIAVRANDLNAVKVLIKHNDDLNHYPPSSDSALRTAVRGNSIQIVKLLLDGGAGVNMHHLPNGPTALLLAIDFNHIDIAKVLIKAGAGVHYRSPDGNSALALAASKNRLFTELLLEHGARSDREVANTQGETPLFYAIRHGHDKNLGAIQTLLKAGCNMHPPNRSASNSARRYGFNEVAKIIDDHERSLRPPQTSQQTSNQVRSSQPPRPPGDNYASRQAPRGQSAGSREVQRPRPQQQNISSGSTSTRNTYRSFSDNRSDSSCSSTESLAMSSPPSPKHKKKHWWQTKD